MPLKRLYDWVLAWAETPFATTALVLLAFAEASFFPVPPDVLLLAMALAQPTRSFFFALMCGFGSTIGGIFGFALGALLWGSLAGWFYHYIPGLTPERFALVQGLFAEHGFWTIFAAGFTPIPYKVFTIAAGVMRIDLPIFIFASLLSRCLRFFIEAALLWKWGEPMRRFIDRYFNLLTLLAVLLFLLAYGGYRFIN